MSGGTPLGRMMIELGLDDTSFGKGVDGAKKRVSYFSKEMQANMRIADLAGDKYGKLGVKFDGLTNIIGAQQQKVEQLRKSYEGSLVDGKPTEQTAKLAGQLQQANGALANYNKQLANTAGDMAKWKIENEGVTGSLMTFGKGLETVGGQMTTVGDRMTKGLTAPIVAGVGLVTKAAIDWESAFAGVKKTNDEVVDGNGKVVYSYDDLEASLRDLTKVLPATHEEIAAVAETAGQLGVKTQDVVSFTKVMLDMGESTTMSAEEAATAMARLANITGMAPENYERLGSVIVELGNNMATTESEITAMGLRLAGAGSQVGMTEAQIMSFAAALSSVGIEAEAGGSAFSKVMIEMQLATEKGVGAFDDLKAAASRNGIAFEDVTRAFMAGGKASTDMSNALGLGNKGLNESYKYASEVEQKLMDFANVAGMSGDEFARAFKDDAAGAIIEFITGLGKAEEQGTSAIKVLDDMNITEVRLRDSLLRAAGASGKFTEAIDMGSKAWDENTALAEEAEKRYGTLKSQLEMLKSEVRNVAIDLGGPFVEAFREGIKVAKPMLESVSKLAKSFADADPKTQQMIMKMIAYTAAAGPVLSITGRIASGIGGMTTKTVGFLGVMAQKKTIKEFTAQLLTGSADIIKWNGAATAGATATASFGTAASTAAGTSGVAGLTGALGALGPVALGIVGAAGVLAVGYGAWKLFGEEAWNSSQRVERWGTDVGGVTDKTLVTIRNNLQDASGQFGLMSDGFDSSSTAMADNFVKIGESVEQNVIKKIEGLDALIKELPDSFDSTMKKIIEAEKANAENSLEIIQENNDRISEIRKKASDDNRELNISEAKMIQDLAKNTTQAYVDTLDLSASEKKKVLSAMTGDVANATEEEAKLWLQSLGKQRQAATEHMTVSRQEKEKYLEDLGYNLDGEFAQKFIKAWDEINQTTVDGFDNQMSTILQKYPELMNEVLLSNGQLISATDQSAGAMIASNESIVKNATDTANKLAENAERNVKALAMTADEATVAGKVWNSLELVDKEGNVKTNAAEIVKEATKDTNTWNQMRLVIHDANLDSNAKLIIGEAAIANGWWDGMAWEDKAAILESNSSEIVIKSLRDSGKWNELSFEEKKALLYSNTPEVMAETMLNLGLWKDYQPLVKELKANNTGLLQAISGSEEYLNMYNGLPVFLKELVATDVGATPTFERAKQSLEDFNSLPEKLKVLLADDSGSTPTVKQAEQAIRDFNSLPEKTKILLTDNSDAMNKVTNAQNVINTYNMTQIPGKTINVLADTSGSVDAINAINQVPDFTQKEVRVTYSSDFIGPLPPGYATGTNFHSGGLATINDQRGPLYKELVERPNGQLFTVEGRNVTLPLERGAKVYTAAQSKSLIPRYENGVGIPKNAKIIQTMDWLNKANESTVNVKADNSGILNKMDKLEKILFGILEKNMIVNIPNQSKSMRDISAGLALEGEINRRGNLT